MTRKLVKWISAAAGVLVLLALLATAVLYWRLQQGPVRLPLLEPYVRAVLHDSLADSGLRVRFRDVVLEIDQRRHLPTLRLRDLSLYRQGQELASAPRAAIALGGRDLLHGRLRVRHLELAGPRLTIHRTANGTFRMGIARNEAMADYRAPNPGPLRATAGPSRSRPETSQPAVNELLQQLRRITSKAHARAGTTLAGLESLRISNARLFYKDDVLGIALRAPAADLKLRRVPYGFALSVHARLRGQTGEQLPVTINAGWRRAEGGIDMSVQIGPAELLPALHLLFGWNERNVGVQLPFSARLGLHVDDTGAIRQASAEVLLGSGRVELPDWLALPLVVREGVVGLDYHPQTGKIVISQGDVRLHNARIGLAGSLQPLRAESGMPPLLLDITVRNMSASRASPLLGRLTLKGTLWLSPPQLKIDDLQLHGDGGGLRLRGMVRQEADGPGIYVSGRARNISHRLLKTLWPPRIGIGARTWLHENVSAGRIPSATLRLAIPGRVLQAAVERDVPMPDEVADVRFNVAGVRFSYVDGWPRVTGANGTGRLTGNHFLLTLDSGSSHLPSGKVLKLLQGKIRTRDLAAKVSPGRIEVRASGSASGFEELMELPPLRLRRRVGITRGRVKGRVTLNVRLRMPFRRGMTEDDIHVERVSAQIQQAEALGMVEAFDLRKGRFDVIYENDLLLVKGNALAKGLPVKLTWQRPLGDRAGNRKPLLQLRLQLSDAQRRRLGYDLSAWVNGPIDLKVEAPGDSWRLTRFKVRMGLDGVALRLPAIGWSRAPRKGTKATFDVLLGEKGEVMVRNLRLGGPGGLRVEGRLRLQPDGSLRDATFSRFELDANNRLALGLEWNGKELNVAAAGPSFDARPLITRLFAPQRTIDRALRSVFVRVNIKQVQTLRGESIHDVRGEVELREGLVRRASLTGRFASGRKVALDLVPARDGLRRLRIISNDAGALLRASGLYSRVLGGTVEFTALLKGGEDGGVQRGLLIMRDFMVRGDKRLARVQRQGRKASTGPRRGQRFRKLVLPFSTDRYFIRIGDAIIRSPEIGATANGMIRRADGAMDIGGTIIPAYALNAAFGKIPVLGVLLTGGKGQGVFGMNYALKGSMSRPKFLVNPLSAVAPGVFRQLFHLGGQNVNPDGTPRKRGGRKTRPRRTNLANGTGR